MSRSILKIIFRVYQLFFIIVMESPKMAISKRKAKKAFQKALKAQGLPSESIHVLTKEYMNIQESMQDNIFMGIEDLWREAK